MASASPQTKDPAARERWVCIYPVYLNSSKTVPEGRRVARERAVRDPTCNEIRDVCNALKFECAVEADKCFPRDFTQVGRVRVRLRNADGSPARPPIASRKALFAAVAGGIQKLSGRAAVEAPSADSSQSQAGKAKKGKKGKK